MSVWVDMLSQGYLLRSVIARIGLGTFQRDLKKQTGTLLQHTKP